MFGGTATGGVGAWRTALACVLLLCGRFALAQGGAVENVRFRNYNNEQGLSQLTVRAIAQSTPGYMWLGTQDGLNRFDGYSFRVYRHDAADATSLPDNHVFALAAASDGSVWIAGQTGGLARYDPQRDAFVRFPREPGKDGALASDRITALLVDRRGTLWLGTREGAVQRLVGNGATRFELVTLAGVVNRGGPVRALRERRDGSLLVGAEHGLWLCTAEGRCEIQWGADADPLDVHAIAEAPNGEIVVATTRDGLVRFDATGRALARIRAGEGGGDGLAHDDTRALLFDARGRLWVGTDQGLSRFETLDGPVRTWRHDAAVDDSLASNRVFALFEGREQLVWVGTWVNGVSVFDPRTEAFGELRSVPGDPRTLPTPVVRAVAADADGTLWLGLLEGGGLVHFDPERGVIARYTHDPARPESLSSNNVQYVTRARDGALWVGTNGGGLDRLRADGGFDHFRHDRDDPSSLGGNSVLHVLVDRSGTLWVSLEGAGLDMRCARCSGFRHFRPEAGDPHSLGGMTVGTVFESSAGEIWVGLRPGGLARFDLTSKSFETFRADPTRPGTLSSDSISIIEETRDGTIWVGTQGGGLNRMVRHPDGSVSFRAITRREGLGADAIGALFEADDGQLWITTTAGVTRYDPASGKIENFTNRSGVQPSGYFIAAAARQPDGRMVFGGLRGGTIIDPARVPDAPKPRQAVITSLRPVRTSATPASFVREVSATSGPTRVELPPDLNDFTVEFSALSYIDPFAVHYDYRLDDYDAGWVTTDPTRRHATYTNLPPGTYAFRVRARINGGAPGPESIAAITIESPWWKTLPARLAYLLAALGVAFAIAWQVRARLREREHAQLRIAESEERLKLALWGAGDELWDADIETSRITRINPTPRLAVNTIPDQSFEGYAPYVHPDDREQFQRAVRDHIRGASDYLDVTYRTLDVAGQWLWVRTRGRIVARDADGRAHRMVGTTEDIDALKQQEASLARLNRELEQRVAERTSDLSAVNDDLKQTIDQLHVAQDQLVESEKMAALGGLVAGVAHEINTPLGIGVTAASHLESETRRIAKRLGEGELSREELEGYQRQAQEATEIILRNLKRADKLVKSFKQVAVDQSSEQKRTLDLCAYLDEVLTSLAPALKRGRHSIEVRCPEPVTLETYPGAIYQIVVNLVMNSVTHAFSGGEQGAITIDVARRGGEVEFDYRDNGGGMTEDVRRRAFEPFFTTRRGQGGSGLGMHIVYNLSTQVLRGRATIESAPGQGFRFLLRFPA